MGGRLGSDFTVTVTVPGPPVHGVFPALTVTVTVGSKNCLLCLLPYYCRTYYKAVCVGGRGTVKDMYYEVRRAEACVD
jgi:hypothetical protein